MSIRGITMTGKGFEGMRESELRALEDVRVKVNKVAQLRAKCDEITPKGKYRSPNLTGMPGGSREPCGLDGSKSDCEKLLEELEQEERILEHMTAKAEKIIDRSGMSPEMREFCRGYFLKRMSVKDTMESMGMSEDSGWKYKRKIYAKSRKKRDGAKEKTV